MKKKHFIQNLKFYALIIAHLRYLRIRACIYLKVILFESLFFVAVGYVQIQILKLFDLELTLSRCDAINF